MPLSATRLHLRPAFARWLATALYMALALAGQGLHALADGDHHPTSSPQQADDHSHQLAVGHDDSCPVCDHFSQAQHVAAPALIAAGPAEAPLADPVLPQAPDSPAPWRPGPRAPPA